MRTKCERCSQEPARLVTSTKNLGLIYAHKTFRTQGLLCRECATRRLAGDLAFTLILGWWSLVSLFANAAFIVADITELSAARKMATPTQALTAAGKTP
jgi:hypothetical protein